MKIVIILSLCFAQQFRTIAQLTPNDLKNPISISIKSCNKLSLGINEIPEFVLGIKNQFSKEAVTFPKYFSSSPKGGDRNNLNFEIYFFSGKDTLNITGMISGYSDDFSREVIKIETGSTYYFSPYLPNVNGYFNKPGLYGIRFILPKEFSKFNKSDVYTSWICINVK